MTLDKADLNQIEIVLDKKFKQIEAVFGEKFAEQEEKMEEMFDKKFAKQQKVINTEIANALATAIEAVGTEHSDYEKRLKSLEDLHPGGRHTTAGAA